MKKLKLTKVIASALVAMSVLALNPIGASAEWRKDSNGWWYASGNSWYTGWKTIDGNWYYFNSNGYMVHNTVEDNYYIYDNGRGVALTNSNINIKMPQDWVRINDSTYANINKTIILYSEKNTYGLNEEDIINGFKQGTGEGSSELKTVEKNFNGHNATCFEFDMNTSAGIKKAYVVLFIKNNITHAFVMASSFADYNQDKKVLEDLLNLTLTL